MPKSYAHITSFMSGQLGDKLVSQVDKPFYKSGLKLTSNCYIDKYGNIRKRPGFKKIYTANDANKTLIPFKGTTNNNYGLLLGTANTICLDKDGTVVNTLTGAGAVSTQIQSRITYVQHNNILYTSFYNGVTSNTDYYDFGGKYYTFSKGVGTFNASTIGVSSIPLNPPQSKYTSPSGYAITSMTTLPREGQTSYTLSGANPGPFTGANGFGADDYRVVYALDGVFEITAVTNDYTLVTTCRRAPSTTSASVTNWSLEYTSRYVGKCIAIHKNRFVRSDISTNEVAPISEYPNRLFLSATNDFLDHYPGPNDDDAFEATVDKAGSDGINWLYSGQDLLIGADNGVFSLTGASVSTFTLVERAGPGGILQTPIGAHGGVYYISSTARQVRFMKYDDRLQGYTNDEVTLPISEEFESTTITRIACTEEPNPTLFVCTASGKIYAGTIIKNALFQSSIMAWTLFADNDKTTWSNIITVRNDNVDELWVFATRSTTYTVEKVTFTIGTDLTSVYSDGAVVYSGSSTASITGLDHLNGLVCQVKGNGVELGDETPSGGSVTIDSASTTAVVGLEYEMEFGTLPVFVPAGLGSLTGQKFRWQQPMLNLYKSKIPTVNGNRYSKAVAPTTINTMEFYTGMVEYGNVDNETLTITDSTPFPVTITGIFGCVEFNGF